MTCSCSPPEAATGVLASRSRLLIVDPARGLGRDKKDLELAAHVARAFLDADFDVVRAIDIDDPLPDRPHARVVRISEPLQVATTGGAACLEDNLPSRPDEARHGPRRGMEGSRALFSSAASNFHAAKTDENLYTLVGALGPNDVMILPAAGLVQLEWLFQLLPRLRLCSPLPSTLHIRLTSEPVSTDDATLGMRLKSGSPVRALVLHADTADLCKEWQLSLGLPVYHYEGGLSPVDLRRRFCAAPMSPVPSPAPCALDVPPSLVAERLAPLVLLVSALWGRVGSTTIFDAQTRYLIESGFIVARVFVDHHPRTGTERARRFHKLLAENFEQVRPHLHFIAERNEDASFLRQLDASVEFRQSSPVKRISMMLQGASIDDLEDVRWCGDQAVFAIVNHLPHVAFTQDLTTAPVVLETQPSVESRWATNT